MKKTSLQSLGGLALLLSLSSFALAGTGVCKGEWSGIDDNGDKVSGSGTCTGQAHCTGISSRTPGKEAKP